MTPERLLLVRHAMPEAVAQGRAAARSLRLPADALLVASDEPKAAQTLHEATGGTPVLVDAGFGEVRRPHGWLPDHRERARAYVDGVQHDGWEPRAAVVARFDAAIARHATPGRTLVVGTHGMAATAWLAARTAIEPGPFWAALRFPDIVEIVAGRIVRPAG